MCASAAALSRANKRVRACVRMRRILHIYMQANTSSGFIILTVVIAPEYVEHAVGRRSKAHAITRGGTGAGGEGVDALEAAEAQKHDNDEQTADTGHHRSSIT